ncbi:MAG: hypothetical protein AB7I32_00040 [Gammaproteobacteria bacterium]
MSEEIWAASTVPVLDAECRVLLPLHDACFAAHRRSLQIDGVCYRPKDEYHVTLVGSALAAHVAGNRAASDALARHLAATAIADWRVLPRAGRLLVQRPEAPAVRAIVQRVDVPAAAAIHAALERVLAVPVPRPPLHVTLYWAGDPRGIGLASDAALAASLVGPIAC